MQWFDPLPWPLPPSFVPSSPPTTLLPQPNSATSPTPRRSLAILQWYRTRAQIGRNARLTNSHWIGVTQLEMSKKMNASAFSWGERSVWAQPDPPPGPG